jgi:hypothetical protein
MSIDNEGKLNPVFEESTYGWGEPSKPTLPPLIASIDGPITLPSNSVGTYRANASGAIGEITYKWSVPPSFSITAGSTSSEHISLQVPSVSIKTTFHLQLNLNDNSGRLGADKVTHRIDVNP